MDFLTARWIRACQRKREAMELVADSREIALGKGARQPIGVAHVQPSRRRERDDMTT
jgi:hypothetical protein